MAMKSTDYVKQIPDTVILSQVSEQVANFNINYAFLNAFKKFSTLNDIEISDILDLNVKTYRSYKSKSNKKFSSRLKEHMLALFSLFKHGENVFGDNESFKQWLRKENFFFDGKTPDSLLFTISGIKFIDDRLSALEYGDNV